MKLIEIRRASLFDLFHFTKKMPSLPDRLSLKVDRKLRVVIVWVFESHPWYLNECLMFNLLYRQLAHTASMRMDTPPVLVGTFKDKRTACGHFVTVGNRPWFGYTCWPYKKTSKCSKPKLFSCWFLWSFRASTESCCVNCLYVPIPAFCRLWGTDYNVSLQCNQTLEPAGELCCLVPLFVLWWR